MSKMINKILRWWAFFGFDFRKTVLTLYAFPSFVRDLRRMKKLLRRKNEGHFAICKLYPVIDEKYAHNTIAWNYFFQDLWVAQLILKNNPQKHVDVGSRIDGFVGHVATYRRIEVYDIRSVRDDIPNVHFVQADLCDENFGFTDYCDSISSLHVVEHLGLGRYGDKLDPEAYLKGLKNITQALQTEGIFYFSVPIGEQRIEFNAHRVFSTRYLLNLLTPFYKLESFAYVNDELRFFPSVMLNDPGFEDSFSCHYGCGIFVLRKKRNWL